MANITIQQLGPTDINTPKSLTMVSFSGDLDQVSIEKDSEQVEQLINQVPDGSIVLFDFSNLMYINSRSISHLVNWYMTLEKKMAKLILFSLRPNILDILDTTGITNLIPIYNNFIEIKAAVEQNQITFGEAASPFEPISPSSPNAGSIARPQEATVIEEATLSPPTLDIYGPSASNQAPVAQPQIAPQVTVAPTPVQTPPVQQSVQVQPPVAQPVKPAPPAPVTISPQPVPVEPVQAVTPVAPVVTVAETPAQTAQTPAPSSGGMNIMRDIPAAQNTPSQSTTNETVQTQPDSKPQGSLTIDRFGGQSPTSGPTAISTPANTVAPTPVATQPTINVAAASVVSTAPTISQPAPGQPQEGELEKDLDNLPQINAQSNTGKPEEFKILQD
jgi:anti-anti-sigma factor